MGGHLGLRRFRPDPSAVAPQNDRGCASAGDRAGNDTAGCRRRSASRHAPQSSQTITTVLRAVSDWLLMASCICWHSSSRAASGSARSEFRRILDKSSGRYQSRFARPVRRPDDRPCRRPRSPAVPAWPGDWKRPQRSCCSWRPPGWLAGALIPRGREGWIGASPRSLRPETGRMRGSRVVSKSLTMCAVLVERCKQIVQEHAWILYL